MADKDDRQLYLDLLDRYKKQSDATNKQIITWAEKFGSYTESISRDFEKLTKKLDTPFYKTFDFWKSIGIAVIILLALAVVITRGGCFAVANLIELGTCQYL